MDKIEIKTLSLGGKKLTKSIFIQIEFKDCFNEVLDFNGTEYYGYVKDKDNRVLIWNLDGKLKKTSLSQYSNLRRINDFYTHQDIEWFLRKCKIKHDAYDDERKRFKIDLDAEAQDIYNKLVDKVKQFISEILDHQIYI